MRYHYVLTDQGDWQIHKLNCQDVDRMRRQRRANAISVIEAESPEALIQRELDDELAGMGYSKDDFRIMPCCKDRD